MGVMQSPSICAKERQFASNNPLFKRMKKDFLDFRRSPIWLIASAGFKIADDESLAKRQEICDKCQYWNCSVRPEMNKSLKCGSTSLKLKLDAEKDPIKKWGVVHINY